MAKCRNCDAPIEMRLGETKNENDVFETREWAFKKLREVCYRYDCYHLLADDQPIPRLKRWQYWILSIFNI